MGVKTVKKKWTDASYNRREGEQFMEDVVTTRGWAIQVEYYSDDETIAATADGLPKQYEAHPKDSSLWCTRLRIRRVGALLYEAVADYETISVSGEDPRKKDKNPLRAEPDISWSYSDHDEIFEMDVDGHAVLNTAGSPPDPPLTSTISDAVCTYSRNERDYSSKKMDKFKNTVCKDKLFGYEKETATMKNTSGQYVLQGEYKYWRVTYVIQFREVGWNLRIRNEGYSELKKNNTTGEYETVVIKDKHGIPKNEPTLLKVDGTRVTEDEYKTSKPGSKPATGTTDNGVPYEKYGEVVWLLFKQKKVKSWGELNLRLPR